MKKKNEKELNAILKCEKKGQYFNLFLEIPLDNGESISLLVKPLMKDSKSLSRLLYKVYMSLGE